MGIDKDYLIFIEEYMDSKNHSTYSHNKVDFYSYSSNTGKFGMSNLMLDELVRDFSAIEVKLFLSILNRLKPSKDFIEGAVVCLKYDSYYSEICSHPIFYGSIKKYLKYNYLIKTPKNKYYIVNTLYVNKFYKRVVDKK